ncbi:MAG: hypothetical protein IE931_06575 [Sphingobacteriales bacterium]|nr:hypothetical protein [Sphingobacteriales bacterium]
MKSNYLAQVLSLGFLTLMISACSSNKLAVQNNNDDVYFSDIKANQADYAVAAAAPKNNTEAYSSPSYGYNDYYNSDYYWMNNNVYYNPYWGPTSFYNSFSPFYYGSGWSFSLGYNYYPSYYGYGNSWGYYGYNRYYPYTGIYSYYNLYSPFYNDIYGYGYGSYPRNIYTVNPRPSNPRPSGAFDNMRPTSSRVPGVGNPISRPIRPDAANSGSNPRTLDQTRTSSTPMSRPVRPTSAPRPTSVPNRQPENRPTRSERPSSPPPSTNTRTSSGGSTSSGGNGGGRPVRPGGH